MTLPDPWEALAQNWPAVPIYVRVMPDRWGQTVWSASGPPIIELAHDASPTQQLCTLCHEYQHLELGADATEETVREATARWLLPDLDEVGTELRDHGVREASKRLGVTRRVLNDRLTTLSAHEQAEVACLLRPGIMEQPPDVPRLLRAVPRCVARSEPDALPGPARSGMDARPD